MFVSLWPCRLQPASLLCPPLSPGVCWSSCPSSQGCHPAISSSVSPFHLLPSIFPSIRVFSSETALCIRWPKYWSFNFSISPSNEYSVLISLRMDWFPLGLTGLISLQSKGLLSGFSSTTIQKHQSYVWVNVKPQNLQQGRKQRKVLSTPVTPLTRENSHTQVTWASPASNILVTLALPSWTK